MALEEKRALGEDGNYYMALEEKRALGEDGNYYMALEEKRGCSLMNVRHNFNI